jgi:hypothetical protein
VPCGCALCDWECIPSCLDILWKYKHILPLQYDSWQQRCTSSCQHVLPCQYFWTLTLFPNLPNAGMHLLQTCLVLRLLMCQLPMMKVTWMCLSRPMCSATQSPTRNPHYHNLAFTWVTDFVSLLWLKLNTDTVLHPYGHPLPRAQ